MILMPDGQDFQGLSSIKRVHSFYFFLSLFSACYYIEIDIVDTWCVKTRRDGARFTCERDQADQKP